MVKIVGSKDKGKGGEVYQGADKAYQKIGKEEE